ncbi:hypothetical protein CEK25_013500 [Fusarium fujikuroi]|nr:hypothetical protein CEK25_013500 [Fusarium fujikuroi]
MTAKLDAELIEAEAKLDTQSDCLNQTSENRCACVRLDRSLQSPTLVLLENPRHLSVHGFRGQHVFCFLGAFTRLVRLSGSVVIVSAVDALSTAYANVNGAEIAGLVLLSYYNALASMRSRHPDARF